MLLESRLSEKLVLYIDAESVGGVDKSQLAVSADPDHILRNTVAAVRAAAEQLGEGLNTQGRPAPVTMEVHFGIRVDSNAVVAIARTPEEGQFRVSFRWDA